MAMNELPDFTQYTEVAGLGCGGKVLFATDDFFAGAEGMLRCHDPRYIPEKYTEFGKWMDGWETRRKRTPGHDWCIIKLSGPTLIKGFLIDTAFFTGNYAPKISIQATTLPSSGSYFQNAWEYCENKMSNLNIKIPFSDNQTSADGLASGRKPDMIGRSASNRDFEKIARLKSQDWTEIVPITELKPGYEDTRYTLIHNTEFSDKYTHLRVNIFPDGGIARFRVYGNIEMEIPLEPSNVVIDVLCLQNGGRCLQYSNAHFGHPKNLNKPGKGLNMSDGWETARRLDRPEIIEMTEKEVSNIPGSEWAIFRLGANTTIVSIEIDTNHFKGNAPEHVTIEGTSKRGDYSTIFDDDEWSIILDKVKLQPHKVHLIKKEIKNTGPFGTIKITMAPDGGISRVRVLGQVAIERSTEPDLEETPADTNSVAVTNASENRETNANSNGDASSSLDVKANTNQKSSTGQTNDTDDNVDTTGSD